MFRKILCVAALVAFAVPAQAGVKTFSTAELNSFTVQSQTGGYTRTGPPGSAFDVVVGPNYSDHNPPLVLSPMSGSAGATGDWNDFPPVSPVDVFLGVTFAETNLSASNFTELAVLAFNDNDDIWGYDVWISTTTDGVVSTNPPVNINGAQSATVKLDLAGVDMTKVTGWGVSVHGNFAGGAGFPSVGDAHHSSWAAVPEPGSLAIFGALVGVGVARRRRNKKA